jgi:hypothetical protein
MQEMMAYNGYFIKIVNFEMRVKCCKLEKNLQDKPSTLNRQNATLKCRKLCPYLHGVKIQ